MEALSYITNMLPNKYIKQFYAGFEHNNGALWNLP